MPLAAQTEMQVSARASCGTDACEVSADPRTRWLLADSPRGLNTRLFAANVGKGFGIRVNPVTRENVLVKDPFYLVKP